MNKPLGYLREIISNYTDRSSTAKNIYARIENKEYDSEELFVRDLSEEEINFLDKILPDEINHAKEENDETRAHNLNEVFEQLF
ncbi:sigma-G-dependent sporulation-specific acid-soluble spore protein CsgA [Bacillus sp. 31A1R]|uniref:Sigma-G-dependent sporulation-specific acid-soluble spore protein CsgA n=1 Tax=Robertmurraya mangrovi TaxID=3098077 RepID=A0ABU5IY35_9BACI|nr:sigma-G-dependent sporulation-specific acid-soluble spore protein CsgA [Bacillus sp. 31A1R]MDZ5472046.1 sigma-G-dependent sporulation-specific acid-soluble spore protein CsgA [Bacillus sp. 31A1R]